MSLERLATLAQSVQTVNMVDLSLSGNTAGVLALMSSGTVTIAGGNNITLSQAGNAFTISAFNQSAQTQNAVDVTLAGNTSGTLALISSGTLTLAGGNNITLSQAGNAVTISGPNTVAQSVQTQNVVDVTLAGNTSGTLALISSGTLTLAGGNNITLSQVGNAVTISATNLAQYSAGVSTGGNTSGTTGMIQSRMVFVGGNNITLSQSINGQSATITISATNLAAFSVGVSTGGNTAGTTGVVGSQLVFVGGNNVTLSESINGASGTISINAAAAPALSVWQNLAATYDVGGTVNNAIALFPMGNSQFFPGNMTVQTVRVQFSCNMSATNASTQAHTYSVYFGLYTLNGASLSLYNSASTSFGTGAANANISSQYHGIRWLTFNSTQFSQSTLSLANEGMYVGALMMRSSGTNHAFSSIINNLLFLPAGNSGTIGTSTANASTAGYFWLVPGYFTATGGLPVSFGTTDISHITVGFQWELCPHLQFDNLLSVF